ncbi:ABC transporter permease [Sporolactobacillus inulinus]|jgi:peptide/nickel transport system permease protein|uniref:Dipeptide transport system permease protein DppC n=2 Tax=Sporolactobacillus inulinus TaxID=2078 RepID=A0A4Y1ZD72_9BACL|nr:ABC transporter permease [Sporolactobacillus inulinus]KLI01563.1 peptide ABC transporter permease [Sporolactobacillus inulinus CASD]GAY76979.1 dipeptide transport system permease protein DppC [Sporolactobacillus inulinus]GEB78461.1 diguanylate cyclase [Sporolactobacillus inulinus]
MPQTAQVHVETHAVKERSPFVNAIREFWKSYRKNKPALFGTSIILVFILLAIFANFIAPQGINDQNIGNKLQAPSAAHWFGTDDFGRDIFSRILFGARLSLRVGFLSVIGSIVVGTLLGILAGYFGKVLDVIISRLFDILLAFPSILLSIAIVAILGPSLNNALVAIAIVNVPVFGRLVRSRVLTVKEEEYVVAARSIGMGDMRIIFHHILPNSIAPIIVQGTLNIATAILDAAGLGFLGMGAEAPLPEWGKMLSDSREYIQNAPWTVLFPGLAIVLVVVGFNLIGDGLRDALDPRMKN